jgi:hypothetical protein
MKGIEMIIGDKTIEKMKQMASEQLETFSSKINGAFQRAEDGRLTVSLSFALGISKIKNGLDIDTTIGFTESKVKDTIKDTVMENQEELPLEGVTAIYRMEK